MGSHRALLSSSFLDLFLPLQMPFTMTAGTASPAAHQACGTIPRNYQTPRGGKHAICEETSLLTRSGGKAAS